VNELRESAVSADSALAAERDLPVLFHRLNNQLGIILACAELVELKAVDEVSRTRAGEIVAKVLDAMGTAKEIRHKTDLV
jgi:hypothetical protein